MPAQCTAGILPLRAQNAGERHLPALDGVRGVAIVLVLLFHLTPDSHVRAARFVEWIYKVAWSGWIGVDLFFVLSGFLITGILLRTREEPRYFTNFYMRRTLRIFPLYFGVLFVIFGVLDHLSVARGLGIQTIAPHQLWFWCYATNFGMALHTTGSLNFSNTPVMGVGHFWSLAVEEHYYLFWPAIVWMCDTRTLARICWVLIAGAFVLRTLVTATHPVWLHPLYFLLLSPLRMDTLAAGSLLAIAIRQHGKSIFFVRHRGGIWVGCGAVLAARAYVKKGLWPGDPFINSIGLSMIACFAAATLALALFSSASRPLGRFWSHWAVRFMGKYSYGIYVFHPFVQGVAVSTLSAAVLGRWLHQPEAGGILFVTICISVTVAVAYASYHLYEKRFLSLKKYFESDSGSPLRGSRVFDAMSAESTT
jgi:peptidoglycan/LPS O-acetylase OafA/YrhL